MTQTFPFESVVRNFAQPAISFCYHQYPGQESIEVDFLELVHVYVAGQE